MTFNEDEKHLTEEIVAYLLACGFLAAAMSASIVGSLADHYGRRAACLVFCVTYSLFCLTVLSDLVPVLFAGRLLGGLSSALMYSVFESWMVTEYHRQHIDDPEGSISNIFGLMTTLNGVVAIVAGLSSRVVIPVTETQLAPFLSAVVCLILAFFYISSRWVRGLLLIFHICLQVPVVTAFGNRWGQLD